MKHVTWNVQRPWLSAPKTFVEGRNKIWFKPRGNHDPFTLARVSTLLHTSKHLVQSSQHTSCPSKHLTFFILALNQRQYQRNKNSIMWIMAWTLYGLPNIPILSFYYFMLVQTLEPPKYQFQTNCDTWEEQMSIVVLKENNMSLKHASRNLFT